MSTVLGVVCTVTVLDADPAPVVRTMTPAGRVNALYQAANAIALPVFAIFLLLGSHIGLLDGHDLQRLGCAGGSVGSSRTSARSPTARSVNWMVSAVLKSFWPGAIA